MTESSSPLKRFEGRVALVSGAASGIGRATSERLAREGAHVICTDVVAEGLEEMVKNCHEEGLSVEPRVCDVSDEAQVEATLAHVISTHGRLDVQCNIAGILHMAHTHEITLEEWERVMRINLTGTFLMCRAAIPHLLKTGGVILNTSSTSALAGLPYGACYGATKGGVQAFTRAIAVEYAKQGMRANCVCPGSVQTGMTSRSNMPENMDVSLIQRIMPLDKPRGPETVAAVIALLCSNDGAHINGEEIRVDGGTLA
ncbi:MAG: SDR family NAD(P)-dependent oxidoreductase [Myxococcota bacterium]|nr:SDR family NAD(P)-dependent oxidoreductase [Myxococcota bacterium]